MNAAQFNKKYTNYLEEGHYGLDVHDPEFIKWLDRKFEEFIKVPGFGYSQIKTKFNIGRFYCKGLTSNDVNEVETKITDLFKTES